MVGDGGVTGERPWIDQARCRVQQIPTSVFFSTPNLGLDVCNGPKSPLGKPIGSPCPVRSECLAWALEAVSKWDDDPGIIGGTTPAQRDELRNKK